jgi:eukaryotic-like serine/threonine-protein kinase
MSAHFEHLPLDRLLKANEACNRFERALKDGAAARLEDFLPLVAEEDRPLLRAELEAIVADRKGRAEDQPPREVGEYELQGELGRGGMGRVYRAVHRTMKRPVAIKFLHLAESEQQAAADQRFQREVEILARLRHANLVSAFDAGRLGAWRYLVTELIDGIDLARMVKRHGPLIADQAIHILEQACLGLEYLHAQGIIHRDLKPANLMMDASGRVRILDVGVARAAGESTAESLTQPGFIVGTVDYMAPEQAFAAQEADARSDLYSLGCTLHFLLEGKPPFGGETPLDILVAHRDQSMPELRASVPPGLRDLVRDLMAKNPKDRPASATEVLARLRALRQPRDSDATEILPAPPPLRRRRTIALALMCLLLVLLTALAAWWFTRSDPPVLEDYPLADAAAYQQRWAKHLKLPVAITDETGLDFVFIPPGRFRMGTPDAEIEALQAREPGDDIRAKQRSEKSRPAEIARPFYLGAAEVTIGQFRKFRATRADPTHAETFGTGYGVPDDKWEKRKGFIWCDLGKQSAADDIPVCNITWGEANDFCNWLNGLTKSRAVYRLPTEAEWEYACRAGSVTPYSCGDDQTLQRHAWFAANANNRLHPVRTRTPNAFGLHDMHGNHAEWCGIADPKSPLFTPIPGGDANDRPSRGGGFFESAERVRSAARDWAHKNAMGKGGFRVLKEIRD